MKTLNIISTTATLIILIVLSFLKIDIPAWIGAIWCFQSLLNYIALQLK